jgi:hypothetical protein
MRRRSVATKAAKLELEEKGGVSDHFIIF